MKQKILLLLLAVFMAISALAQENDENISGTEDILPQLQNLKNINRFFQLHDIAYYKDIMNDPVNALKYKGDHKIAANMGVYMADMVYVMGTEGYKTADDNFGAILQLAEKMDLDEDFRLVLIDRYTDESISADEIAEMMDKALQNSEKKLSQNDRKEFFDYILYGNYIEKLYIISSLLIKSESLDLPKEAVADMNRTLLLFMAKQRHPLEDMSKLMIGYSSNIIDHLELRKLIHSYEKLEANKEKLLKLPPSQMYKATEIKTIEQEIKIIRDKIIEL